MRSYPERRYYVYRLTNPVTGEFYIGSRTVFAYRLNSDQRYMGSGTWLAFMKRTGVVLEKVILAVFDGRKDARKLEYKLIKQYRDEPLCRNILLFCGPLAEDPRRWLHLKGKRSPQIRTVERVRAFIKSYKGNANA